MSTSGRFDQDGLHDMVGVYLLGALPEDEVEAFEEHLHGCVACQVELEAMEPVVVALADYDRAEVPAGLIDSLLAELPEQHQANAVEVGPRSLGAAAGSRRLWPTILASAAALVIAVGLAAVLLLDGDPVDDIVAAEDLETITLAGDGGEVDLYFSDQQSAIAVVDASLGAVSESEVFAVWVVRGDETEFVGILDADDGVARQSFDVDLEGVTSFAISIETDRNPEAPPATVVYSGDVT